MRKFLLFLLLFGLLMSFSACEKEPEMVTIYIPVSVEIEVGEGTFYGPMGIAYEKGWQNKESFTMSYYIETDELELQNTTTYGNKTTKVTSGSTTKVSNYDDKGNLVLLTITGNPGKNILKIETATEYDEHNRTLKKTQTTYYTDGKENDVTVTAYTYTDTVQGSEGVCVQGDYTYRVFYDEQYRCIGAVTFEKDKEISKTEYTYDEYGNPETSTVYVEGVQDTRTVYTYKAVTISREKAEQLPMFVRAK